MIQVFVYFVDRRNELHSSPIAEFRDASSCYFTKTEGDRYLHHLLLLLTLTFDSALNFHVAVNEGQEENYSHLSLQGGGGIEIDSKINGLFFQGLLKDRKYCSKVKIDFRLMVDCDLLCIDRP